MLKETLNGFMLSTQEIFLKVSQAQQEMMQSQLATNKNVKVSIKNLEAQIRQLSKKIEAWANLGGGSMVTCG